MFSESIMMDLLYRKAIENDPVLCPYGCGTLFTGRYRKKNLKRHLNNSCFVNPKIECKYCKKTIKNRRSLDYHMMTNHHQLLI